MKFDNLINSILNEDDGHSVLAKTPIAEAEEEEAEEEEAEEEEAEEEDI